MNILSISYPFSEVSQVAAGGAEQVLFMLDESLSASGHNSYVIAPRSSKISGTLIEIPAAENEITEEFKLKTYKKLIKKISEVTDSLDIDLIHFHGVDFYNYLPESDIPALVTLHLPESFYPKEKIIEKRDNVFYNCVSSSQLNSFTRLNNITGFITNGIKIKDFPFNSSKKDYILCLGRICWEKGYHLAVKAALESDIPLIIAGEIFPYKFHTEYFEQSILPFIDNEKIKLILHPDRDQKLKLLSEACSVLIPSIAEETSSLVAMEAFACGTPVIGFNTGALPEIIENGKTGLIINNEYEIKEAVSRIKEIDNYNCRYECERRYSSARMVHEYIQLFEKILEKEIFKKHAGVDK